MTEHHDRSAATEQWPPLKMALWRVLMDERLNDGHYIKAFDLIEKLYSAARSVDAAQQSGMREALEDLWALTANFSQYTLEHFARKVRAKVESALAAHPPVDPVVATIKRAPELLDAAEAALGARCSAGNAEASKAAIAPNYQSLKAAKEPALADGCCSAVQPCSHQKADPTSICDTCRASHGGAQ